MERSFVFHSTGVMQKKSKCCHTFKRKYTGQTIYIPTSRGFIRGYITVATQCVLMADSKLLKDKRC